MMDLHFLAKEGWEREDMIVEDLIWDLEVRWRVETIRLLGSWEGMKDLGGEARLDGGGEKCPFWDVKVGRGAGSVGKRLVK